MAGTAEQTRSWKGGKSERLVQVVYTSDASDGSVPNESVPGLSDFALEEVITTPSSGATAPTTTYRVKLVSATGGTVFLGGDRALDSEERQGGYEYNGKTPSIIDTLTLSLTAADGSAAANIGNSNIVTIGLIFKRK